MNLTKCSYCGGALKTVGVANNRSKYQCHHCKAIIDIEEDRAEKWFAFEEYINAIVACYSEVGNDRDVAERFHNNTEIKEKWGNVKKYAHDVLSTPYLAVLHALYLTEGFTRFSRRAESLIAVARERDHQSDHFKTCIRDYDKKRAEQVKKQKTRTTLIIVMVFLVVLVAVLGAVAYQPTFYDESTGISVEISQKLMGFVDKFRMTLTVEEHPESSPAYIDAKHALRRETEKFHLYDIVLKNGSEPFLFDGSVTVSIPIPEGYEVGNLKIYGILSADEYEELPSKVSLKEGIVEFDVTHFSLYALAEYYPQVVFDTLGGSAVEMQVVKRGENVDEPSDPTKAGYSFVGWMYNGELWDFAVDTVTEDITLTAAWNALSYTVQYKTCGGIAINDGQYTTGEVLALPIPLRDGYRFEGWYDNQDYLGNAIAQLPQGCLGDLTYYAKWSDPIPYTIAFDTHGGDAVSMLTFTVESDTVTLPLTATRNHYFFEGWYDNEQYQGSTIVSVETGSTGNRTYYAKWIPIEYTATLLYQDSANTRELLTYTVEKPLILPIPEVKAGEEVAFAEWCLDQDGTTVFVNDLAEAPRNITLYGKWTREFLTVFFDTNGGESVVANKPVSYGKSFGTLPIPTRRNYTFLGWFTTSSEIGGVQITESSVPTSYEDITLYARWKRKSATLIFNANEGVVSDASKDVLCGDPYGVLPIPTRDGYRFEGWYTAKTGEEKITEATICESEGNITVYAHWALKETITAPASSVPSDAEILNRWWTYTKTETKESTSATLSGWTRVGSYWKKIGSGSVTYASFPDGFDKTHSFYTSMQDISDEEVLANLPKNSETETTKREVETLWQAYIYWHWMYELAQPYGAGNRVICYVSQGVTVDGISRFPVFNAFISATAYDPIQSGGHGQTGVYQWYIVTTPPSGVDHNGTKYWYRFSYYIRNYTDYQKIYQFERVTTDLKSSVAVTPGDGISNVQEMVEYRPK